MSYTTIFRREEGENSKKKRECVCEKESGKERERERERKSEEKFFGYMNEKVRKSKETWTEKVDSSFFHYFKQQQNSNDKFIREEKTVSC